MSDAFWDNITIGAGDYVDAADTKLFEDTMDSIGDTVSNSLCATFDIESSEHFNNTVDPATMERHMWEANEQRLYLVLIPGLRDCSDWTRSWSLRSYLGEPRQRGRLRDVALGPADAVLDLGPGAVTEYPAGVDVVLSMG
ncbi:hypothetical protein N0V93_005925 [Gnomoniopsis smithogilvyi]|uniref:Uncharacterized protein n=1 Tax=Gnomoniopsis smithogilvyi TaxID=1191159 RepID=A0A9W9CYG7_9PEZI|nr:hypothetical protein N0V93_005925 [Gnomoniopsis smithogilvyi]